MNGPNQFSLGKVVKYVCSFFLFMLLSSFSSNQHSGVAKQFYPIAKVGSLKMDGEKMGRLTKAFKAGYGKQLGFESLHLEKADRNIWLVVEGSKGTLAIPLKARNGMNGIDTTGPLGAVNCHTTSSCSCCKATSCACSKKNGGQDDCGSSACDKSEVDVLNPTTAEILMG